VPEALRILVVRFGSIGDVLLTTPLLRTLRARHPAATISALTKTACAPLLSDNPHVDDVLTLDRRHSLAALARRIRRRDYTHLLDLQGNLRSRVLRLLVPARWRGFDARRGPRRALIRYKRNTYQAAVPVPERYFEAADGLDVRPDGGPAEFHLNPSARDHAERWLAEHRLSGLPHLVALAPGAAHATKRWPPPYWNELAAGLAGRGAGLVILGGTAERDLCEAIAIQAGGLAASATGLGLQETGALIARCAVAVSGDTGAMHMATAVNTPVVALFGPTVEAFGFFPYRARATVLQVDLGCRPCSSKGSPSCPLVHHRCMREIVPGQVATALEALWH
jgi:heptosyltransferase-2